MPAESEWVVSWLVSHVLAFRSPIYACPSQCDAIGRAWARLLAGACWFLRLGQRVMHACYRAGLAAAVIRPAW